MAESKRTKYRLWSALNIRQLTRQGQENMTVKHNNKYFSRCLEPQIKHYAVLHRRQSSWSHQCSREEQLDLFNDQSFFFFFFPRLTSCRRSSLQIPFPDYPNVSQGGEGRWSTLKRLHAETLLPEGSFLACCKPSSLFFNHYDRSGMAVPWISSVEAFQQSTFGPNVCPSTCNAEAEYILSCILVVLFLF